IEKVGQAGAYGGLALVVLAFEAVLLAWLIRATPGAERMAAGVLMVLLFLAVIGAIIFIEYIRHPVSSPTVRQAVATLTNKALLPQEISRVSQTSSSDKQEPDELMSAPDGSYVIARPPAGWSVVSTTVEDTFKEMFGARNMPKQGLVGVSSILL